PPTPPPPASWSGSDELSCPYCGARRITSAAVKCWMCQEKLPAHEGPLPKGKPLSLPTESNVPLMILGVVILVVAGVLMIEAPGVAIVLALLATPALIRAGVKTHKQERALGQSLTGGEKWGIFFSSLGAVILMGVAAFAAFF